MLAYQGVTTTADRVLNSTKSARALAEIRRWLTDGTARRIREQSGLNIADMGRAMDMDGSAILNWESGVRRPAAGNALRLHAVLTELRRGLEPDDAA